MSEIVRLELLIPVENEAERCAIIQSYFDGTAVDAVKKAALYGQGTSIVERLHNIEFYTGNSYGYLAQLSTYLQSLVDTLEVLTASSSSPNNVVTAATSTVATTAKSASTLKSEAKKPKAAVERSTEKTKGSDSQKTHVPRLIGIKRMTRS